MHDAICRTGKPEQTCRVMINIVPNALATAALPDDRHAIG